MSRTDKDRPYWLKTYDETLPRREVHDHIRLGSVAPRYHPQKEQPSAEQRTVYNFSINEIVDSGENLVNVLLKPEEFPDLMAAETEQAEFVNLIPDYCTIDDIPSDWSWYPYHNNIPCHHILINIHGYTSPTRAAYNKKENRSKRHRVSQVNHALLKQVNNLGAGLFDEDKLIDYRQPNKSWYAW